MSLLLAGISVLIACELFLVTPLVKVVRGLGVVGAAVTRVLMDSTLSDDAKQTQLLNSSLEMAWRSGAILGLLLLCVGPLILVSVAWPPTIQVFLDPVAASVAAACSLAYMWLRRRFSA